jgi:uncharacterized MAPEG superfamily protein
MPTELTVLGASVVLLVVHIMLQGRTATRERGLAWNAGARDGEAKPLGPLAGRAARALANFQETYPAFVALALGLVVSGHSGGLGAVGAIVWLIARIVYIPLYLLGVPYVRSLAWTVSMLGLLLMLIRFF